MLYPRLITTYRAVSADRQRAGGIVKCPSAVTGDTGYCRRACHKGFAYVQTHGKRIALIICWNVDNEQVITTGENAISNCRFSCSPIFDITQIGATVENIIADFSQRIGQYKLRKSTAAVKCIITNFRNAGFNHNLLNLSLVVIPSRPFAQRIIRYRARAAECQRTVVGQHPIDVIYRTACDRCRIRGKCKPGYKSDHQQCGDQNA